MRTRLHTQAGRWIRLLNWFTTKSVINLNSVWYAQLCLSVYEFASKYTSLRWTKLIYKKIGYFSAFSLICTTLSICLSFFLSICMYVCLSLCLYVCLLEILECRSRQIIIRGHLFISFTSTNQTVHYDMVSFVCLPQGTHKNVEAGFFLTNSKSFIKTQISRKLF